LKNEDPWSGTGHEDDSFLAAIESVPEEVMSQSLAISVGPTTSSQLLQSKPYTYLQDITQNVDCIEVVKGCIVSLASKLTVGEDESGKFWRVKVFDILLTFCLVLHGFR
jgi:hypothetical protein